MGNSTSGEAQKNQHVTCSHHQLLGPRDFLPRPFEEKNKPDFWHWCFEEKSKVGKRESFPEYNFN
jgi:hypothetical protein